MTSDRNAEGNLLGLACCNALSRPVGFNGVEENAFQHSEVTEILGQDTHSQPPRTITDDTDVDFSLAENLIDCSGFDLANVTEWFVDWLDSDPSNIGLMTPGSLSRIRQGTLWDDADADVWELPSEGSNTGNGSVMRCSPHAIAFRHFGTALTQISSLLSAITHADPRCWLDCVILNRASRWQQTLTAINTENQLADLRNNGQTIIGELQVMYDSLRRVTVQQPGIEHEQWKPSTAQSGVDE